MRFFVLIVITFGFYSLSTTQVVQENILNPFIKMDIKLKIAFIGLFGVILAQIIAHYFSKSREYEKKYIDIFEKLYAPYILDIFEHVETLEKEYTNIENRLKVLISAEAFHGAEKELDSIIKNIRENTAYMSPGLLNIYFQVNRELKKTEKKTKLEPEDIFIKRKKMRLQYELLIVYLKQFRVTTRKAGLLSISLLFRLKRFLKILEVYNIKVNCFLDEDLSLFEKVRCSLRLFFISPTALMRKEFYKEDSNENIES